MGDFRNEVMYSEGRAKILAHCPRQFWYMVYRMWGGWWFKNKAPPKAAEEAYVAKFAETIYTFMGKVVHQQAAWGLQNAKWLTQKPVDYLHSTLQKRAASDIEIGLRQARNQRAGNPKKRLQLVEFMSGDEVDDNFVRDRVSRNLSTLCGSDELWSGTPANLYLRAMGSHGRIVSVEDMMHFHVEGIRVNFALDLMMRARVDGDKNSVIVDWKTGKKRRLDTLQVKTYGAWAATVGWKSVKLLLVYLSESGADVVEVEANMDDSLAYVTDRVNLFLDDLRPRLVDGDVQKNEAIESAFEPTDRVSNCHFCPFQQLCERDGTKPGS